MQFLIIAYDYEDALQRRLSVRDEHVRGVKKLIAENKVLKAAALIEDNKMIGSTLFVDFKDEDELDDYLAKETYVVNKVWNLEEIQIVPIKLLPKS